MGRNTSLIWICLTRVCRRFNVTRSYFPVVPEESKYVLLKTKVELRLKKLRSGKWAALEKSEVRHLSDLYQSLISEGSGVEFGGRKRS